MNLEQNEPTKSPFPLVIGIIFLVACAGVGIAGAISLPEAVHRNILMSLTALVVLWLSIQLWLAYSVRLADTYLEAGTLRGQIRIAWVDVEQVSIGPLLKISGRSGTVEINTYVFRNSDNLMKVLEFHIPWLEECSQRPLTCRQVVNRPVDL